jgi:hypothetical protein
MRNAAVAERGNGPFSLMSGTQSSIMEGNGDVSGALAAMQHPEISAAINAAIIGVLQRYDTKQLSRETFIRPEKRRSIKPIVTNNLFIITAIWTIVGLFLLFAAVRNSDLNVEVAIFAIYGIVQMTLVVFTVIVTSKQVQKVYKRSITLGFLLQGWFALVLSFAGTYLFLQNAYSIGFVKLHGLQEQAASAVSCALHKRTFTMPSFQIGSVYSRATAFQGICLSAVNATAYDALPDAQKEQLCVGPLYSGASHEPVTRLQCLRSSVSEQLLQHIHQFAGNFTRLHGLLILFCGHYDHHRYVPSYAALCFNVRPSPRAQATETFFPWVGRRCRSSLFKW